MCADKIRRQLYEPHRRRSCRGLRALVSLGGRRGLDRRLEAVMNSISNGLGMRNTGTSRKPNRPWNPHFYAIFTQVHNTLYAFPFLRVREERRWTILRRRW